jgi:hypothetical protein
VLFRPVAASILVALRWPKAAHRKNPNWYRYPLGILLHAITAKNSTRESGNLKKA